MQICCIELDLSMQFLEILSLDRIHCRLRRIGVNLRNNICHELMRGYISISQERIIIQQIHQFLRIAGFIFFEQLSVEIRIEWFLILQHIENQAG